MRLPVAPPGFDLQMRGQGEFGMTKRHILKSLREAIAGAPGDTVWVAVGRRLQRRRKQLDFSAEHVAQWAGLPLEAYEGYERGEPIPASLLAQIADLFNIPVVWFFEGLASEEPVGSAANADDEPAVFRVATVEHRIQALADSFRKLDFEGQQHLLAISAALCRSNAGAAHD
jgi:transcriptional regulator with XRE-family HTH domain